MGTFQLFFLIGVELRTYQHPCTHTYQRHKSARTLRQTARLFNRSSPTCEIRICFRMFPQSWTKRIQSTLSAPNPFSSASTLIFSYQCLAFSSFLFLSRSSITPLHAPLIYHVGDACPPAHAPWFEASCYALNFRFQCCIECQQSQFLAVLAYNFRRKHNFACCKLSSG